MSERKDPGPPAQSSRDEDIKEVNTSKSSGDSSGIENENGSRKHRFVEEQSLVLFDRFIMLHDLDQENRQILSHAAFLFNLPLSPGKKRPFKQTKKALKGHIKEGLDSVALDVLAVVLALQNKNLKPKEISKLDLSPIQRRASLTLAAILRISVGLDTSGTQQTRINHTEVSPSRIWIVVDGPEALADSTAAQQKARLWEKLGYPPIRVTDTGNAAEKFIPFPEPIEKPDIHPHDSLAQAARKVMSYQFAEMLRHEEGTRLGEDIDALHQMRVATRRLRSAFGVFQTGFEPGALEPYIKGLRTTGRKLGRVRDLDVFIYKIGLYIGSLPEDKSPDLGPLLDELEKKRDRARTDMLSYLDSKKYFNFKRKFNMFLKTPGLGIFEFDPSDPKPHRVDELAPLLIYDRFARVRAFDSVIPDASLDLLHCLRIEIKRFRYTLEYFKEVLGEEVNTVIDQLKNLQDHLGDLNDARVSINRIENFTQKKQGRADGQDDDLIRLPDLLANRQAEFKSLMESFPQAWLEFNTPELHRLLASAVSVL
jgi:CHAD domain-containing protein